MISLLILLLVLVAIYYINHAIPFTPDWLKRVVDIVLGLVAIVQVILFFVPLIAKLIP